MIVASIIIAVALGAALTSCTTSRYNQEAVKQRFHGKTEVQLLSCAGAPSAARTAGNVTILTYSRQSIEASLGLARTDSCRMNFTLTDGVVTKVTFSHLGSLFNPMRICDQMVGSC